MRDREACRGICRYLSNKRFYQGCISPDFSPGMGALRGYLGKLMYVCSQVLYVLGYSKRVFISNGGLARSKEAI